jgi:cellulose synthase/poly-beta-1,6-N-acetylglucosamine synthase-like glycosyltransferase
LTSLAAIHILWTTLTYRARTADPKMRLRGDSNLPSVDVFIVASGQADQTVFDCAVAAASMDYPPHRYRVMVLDAGGSENLQKELARHAKAQACPHLSYHRRELGATGGGTEGEKSPKMTVQQRRSIKEDRIGNKANSINFGMMEASSFGIKGPAEYVAVFDADVRLHFSLLLSFSTKLTFLPFRRLADDPRAQLPPRRPPSHPHLSQDGPHQDPPRLHQPPPPSLPTCLNALHRLRNPL